MVVHESIFWGFPKWSKWGVFHKSSSYSIGIFHCKAAIGIPPWLWNPPGALGGFWPPNHPRHRIGHVHPIKVPGTARRAETSHAVPGHAFSQRWMRWWLQQGISLGIQWLFKINMIKSHDGLTIQISKWWFYDMSWDFSGFTGFSIHIWWGSTLSGRERIVDCTGRVDLTQLLASCSQKGYALTANFMEHLPWFIDTFPSIYKSIV